MLLLLLLLRRFREKWLLSFCSLDSVCLSVGRLLARLDSVDCHSDTNFVDRPVGWTERQHSCSSLFTTDSSASVRWRGRKGKGGRGGRRVRQARERERERKELSLSLSCLCLSFRPIIESRPAGCWIMIAIYTVGYGTGKLRVTCRLRCPLFKKTRTDSAQRPAAWF